MGVSGGSKCTFKPCGNYSRTSCLSFFTFPKEEERCHRWIVASQRADLLELFDELHAKGKDITYFNRNYTLCSNHFEDHCFMNAREKKRLLKDAVPTLFSVQNSSFRRLKPGRRTRRVQQLNSSSSTTSSRGSSLSRCIKQTRHDDHHQTPSSPLPLVINIPGNMSSPVIINIPGAKNSPLVINVANGEVYTSVDPRVDVDTVENSISLAHALPALTGCGPGLSTVRSHKRKKSELSVITINSPSKSYGGPMERVSSKRLKSHVSTSKFTRDKSAAVQITDRYHEYLDGTEAEACMADVKVFSSPDSRPPRLINIAAFSTMVNSPYKSLSDSTEDLHNSTMSVCSAELDDHLSYAENEQESKFIPPTQPNEWREYRTGRLTPFGLGWNESSRPPLRGRALKLKKVRLQQRHRKLRRPLPQQELRYSSDLEDRKPVFPLDYPVKREPFLDASPPMMCLSSSSDDSNSGEDFDQSGLELTSKLRRFRTHRDIVRSSLGPVPPVCHTNRPLCGAPANSSEEVIRRMAFAPSPPRFSHHTSKHRRKTLNELRDKINSFDVELTELVNENQLLTRELYIYRSKKHLYREKLRKILRDIRAKETRRYNKDDCVLQYCRERMPLSTFKFFKCQLLSCKCPQWDFDSMQIPVIAKRCGLGVRETFYQILRMPAFRTFTNYRNILKKNLSAVDEGNLVRDDFMKKYHRKLERRRKGPRGPSRRKTCKSISSAIKDYLQRNEEEVAYEQ